MQDNDSAFKYLLSVAPAQFVARFVPGAEYMATLTTELSRPPLRADALLRIRLPDGREFLLQIEFQTASDALIALRLAIYALLAMLEFGLPVLSVVVYLERVPTPTSPWEMRGPHDELLHQFHFQVVRLWEESVDDLLASGLTGLYALAPLLRGATVETLGTVAEGVSALPPVERSNLMFYAVMFARRAFTPAQVIDYLRRHPMLDAYIKESSLYAEILAEGEAKGKAEGEAKGKAEGEAKGKAEGEAKGKAEGLAEGLAEGELEALRKSLVALVQRRFPELAATAEATGAGLSDAARLQALVVEVALAPDMSAVQALLAAPPPAP